jgi:hypothetical protein
LMKRKQTVVDAAASELNWQVDYLLEYVSSRFATQNL